MANKPKPQGKSNDARKAAKAARTNANKIRRAKKHAARMATQTTCSKRGLRRSLVRWCGSVSRQPAVVLTTNMKLASLVRRKRVPKVKDDQPLNVSINGKQMGSMAELAWTGRQLEQERQERVKGSAAA